MSMNGLKQFITNVRTSKDSIDESKKIDKELKHIFEQFQKINKNNSISNKDNDGKEANDDSNKSEKETNHTAMLNYNRRKYICKLIYIQLNGYKAYTKLITSNDKFIKLGIEQCLSLLNTQLTNYSNDENNNIDLDSNLKSLKEDREIGFLGFKTLFNEFISQSDFESIVTCVLIDISSIIVFKNSNNINNNNNNKKNNNKDNILNVIWSIVSIGLQSIGDLIIWVKDFKFNLVFLKDLVNSILDLLNIDNLKVPEFVKIRAVSCLSQIFKFDQLKFFKNEILTVNNLTIIKKVLAQSNLKNSSLIVSICSLLDNWIIFDWESIFNIKGLLITKLNETLEILNNSKKEFNWVKEYGLMIISIFDTLSNLITISNNKNNDLKLLVNNILIKCINDFKDGNKDNKDNKLIITSIIFSGLKFYLNDDINEKGELNKDDISKSIEFLIEILKFNNDYNIKISCLNKLILITSKSNNYGNGKKLILDNSIIWKKLIHDKDIKICQLTCKILYFTISNNVDESDENFKIGYNQIKEILIYLMYYLQKCDSKSRGEVLSNILTILEKYKECGILNEISKKLLKIFIIIGNCSEHAWIRIFELIIYSTDNNNELIEFIIEFTIKGLSVGCCENFIKLSCLIFKKNCENWKIGDLNSQLILIIEKYENSTLLTKLLILDTMKSFYNIIEEEKLKNMINLAFEQEMECNNIEIKQRAHEYFLINKFKILLDDDLSIENINKLPKLSDNQDTYQDSNQDVKLNDKWEEGYIRLLRFDQGILFDNDNLRIIFRVKRFIKGNSEIELNYKLKNENKKIEYGLINIEKNKEYYNINLESDDKINKIILKFDIKQMYSEDNEPIIQFRIPKINEIINLKLSLSLKSLHISEGNKMTIAVFQSRWNQIGKFMLKTGCYKREITTKDLFAGDNINHFVELLVRILKKMNFEIITADVNSNNNEFVITCASILSFDNKNSSIGCLCMITSSSVEIRCTGVGIVENICDRILVVLENLN